MSSVDYNARIALVDEHRPGFAELVNGLIEIARDTGEIPDELRNEVLDGIDRDVPIQMVQSIVDTYRNLLAEAR